MYKYTMLPNSITYADVEGNNVPDGYILTAEFAYDEIGTRVWYTIDNKENGKTITRLFVPNVGVYSNSNKNLEFKLDIIELVGGGYRVEENGQNITIFPLTDVQGNVRGFLKNGTLVSAYDYFPYGSVIDMVAGGSSENNNRWQSKEYDDKHGKYYFGSRYYDPVFGMWMSPDPAGQFVDPYTYGGDPINVIDHDGRWGISSLFTPLTSIVSAIIAAKNSDSFGEGLGAFFIDYVGNNFASLAEPTISAASVAWGLVSSVGGVFHATFGDGNWGDAWKPLGVSIGSLFVSEFNTWNNAFAAGGRGDYGEIFTNLASADVNSIATDYNAFQYSTNKGFGSQKYTFEGSYKGSGGHRNIIWGQKTNDHGTENAMNLGQNITLYKSYYEKSDSEKQSVLVHEFVHARQQSKYGLGGMTTRKIFREMERPIDASSDCGMFGFSCEEVLEAFDSYNNNGSLDYAEIEAELNQNAGVNSNYWFDAPIFY